MESPGRQTKVIVTFQLNIWRLFIRELKMHRLYDTTVQRQKDTLRTGLPLVVRLLLMRKTIIISGIGSCVLVSFLMADLANSSSELSVASRTSQCHGIS